MLVSRKTKQMVKSGAIACVLLWIIYLVTRRGDHNPSESKRNSARAVAADKESIYDSSFHTAAKADRLTAAKERRIAELRQVIYDIKRPNDTKYAINETKSQSISVTRRVPDTRPPECLLKTYDISSLPTVSVIIPMYNEAPSILLRTVHSFLSRTPPSLLADIIVVDDMSTNENMKDPLTDYFHAVSPIIRILRLTKKAHLIRARMAGASIARGDVLLFQDGHTEANVGWAEPVLDYIKQHRNTIVQPAVDSVDQWTIEYEGPSQQTHDAKWRGVFLWDMRYAWQRTPTYYKSWLSSNADPYPCPVLVGCSIAVDKGYFEEIGGFDTGLDIWGGEQIELSFRAWMCGGRVVIHPCGRAGHIFKPWMKADMNWKVREKAIAKNNIRVGESWMERYSTYYYAANRIYEFKQVNLTEEDKAGILERRALKKKLNCESFDWYLKNVLPELAEPPHDSKFFGEVGNVKTSRCFFVTDDEYVGLTEDCYLYSRFQEQGEFSFRENGRLMYGSKCVIVDKYSLLHVTSCDLLPTKHGVISFELYGAGQTNGYIKYTQKGFDVKCLEQITNVLPEHNGEQMPQFGKCKQNNEFQMWRVNYHFEYGLVPPALFEGDLRFKKEQT